MDAKSMMAKAVMAASLCAVTTGLSALGGTYYVSPDGTGAAFSPEAPGSLADVVSRAGEGDEIVLKRGVYHLPSIFSAPDGTDGAYDYLSLSGKSGLVFRSEDGDRRGTVLSGDGAKVSDSVGIRAAYFHGSMTFCGMTVSNFCGSYGGAITAQGATVSNCLFVCNRSLNGGGAGRYGTWIDCEFVANRADEGGALLYAEFVSNCVFRCNTANRSGAISPNGDVVWDSLFLTNSVPDFNGGACYANGRSATFHNCRFEGNSAGWGGAVAHEGAGQLTTYDCTFVGNVATTGPVSQNCRHVRATARRNRFRGGRAADTGIVTAGAILEDCDFADNCDTSALTYDASNAYELRYRLATKGIPSGEEKYPLVIALHGAGERGTDNRSQLTGFGGLLDWMDANLDGYWFVAPQVPPSEQWVDVPWGATSGAMPSEPTAVLAATWELVERLKGERSVDADRIYVTGMSMGGYGVWDVLSRHGPSVAAAMPLCGGGDPAQAAAFKDVSVWAFHGADDRTVPVVRSQEMVAAMRSAGAAPRYTEYAGLGHDIWTTAYADGAALSWLFDRRAGAPWTAAQDAAYEAGASGPGGEGGGPADEDVANIPNGIYVSPSADGAVAHACTYEDPGTLPQGVARVTNGSSLVLMRGTYDIPALFPDPVKTDGAYDYMKLSGKSDVTVRSIDRDPNGTVLAGDGTYGDEGRRLCYSKLTGASYWCGLTVSNFNGNWGGALTFHGNETVTNCIFRSNVSRGVGGACRNGNFVSCLFADNRSEASEGGGALYHPGTVKECVFLNNRATAGGGAICAANSTIVGCRFLTNTCQKGAVYVNRQDHSALVKDCLFDGNVASWGGGAVLVDRGSLEASDCRFVGNLAQNGAACYRGTYSRCTFSDTETASSMFGIVSRGTFDGCLFTRNSVPGISPQGAAIAYKCDLVGCTISNCTVNGNISYQGSLSDCVIADNFLSGQAGPNETTLKRCVFSGNVGGSYVGQVAGAALNCLFIGNKLDSGELACWGTAVNCTYVRNTGGNGVVGGGTFTNCLFADNAKDFHAATAATHCLYQTGAPSGTDCIQISDPKFAPADERHPYGCAPRSRSPAVLNPGDASLWTDADVDLAGCRRLRGGAVDVGCYQFWPLSGLVIMFK